MEVYEAMRTAFAAREYTAADVTDETLYRVLDNARFAPSGGNRQGWRVVVIKDKDKRRQISAMLEPTIKQYKAQARAGETPFCSVGESSVTQADIDAMPATFPLVDQLEHAPVVLAVCVDLKMVTSFDKTLDRVGVISGASIYPFVWNILLAARNEGLGGVLTTFIANQERAAKALLNIPDDHAIAAMVCMGEPVKQLTRLRRNKVEDFAWVDAYEGETFESSD